MDVSRSGRIRKKSSKLADSLTDDESPAPKTAGAGKLFASPSSDAETYLPDPGEESPIEDLDDLQEADYDIKEEDFDQIPDVVPDRENDDDDDVDVVASGAIDDDEEGNLEIDETRGQRGAKGRSAGSSIYLAEKRPRPSFKSPASGMGGKKMRKDKGKPRFTAYMLWAKANRDNVVKELTGGNTQPTDFTAVTKRLSEIWSSVPMSEKYQWKKKASKLSYKMARQQVFQARREAATAAAAAASPKPSGGSTGRLRSPPPPPIPMPVLRVTGTEPLDSAAHLKLLGESLKGLGQRLNERKGQIPVTGSLCVLLDSMLCAMAPLLCVTQQVPELQEAIPQETLNKMLDNIAYIIPGL